MTVNKAIELLEHLRDRGYGESSMYAEQPSADALPKPLTDFTAVDVKTPEGDDIFIVPVCSAFHDDINPELMLAL